jgi:hypothetical protein
LLAIDSQWEGCGLVEEDSERSSVLCDKCRVEMQPLGGVKFRTGGVSGGMGFLLGKWAELREDTLQLNVYVCPQCRRIELFYAGPSREFHKPEHNTDTTRSFLKACAECKKTIPLASEKCPFCGSKQPSRRKR